MPNTTRSNSEFNQVKTACPTHLHRTNGVDVLAVREVLLLAFLALEPNDQTQRQVFNSILPEVYMLRSKKGYTFNKITALLRDCGIKLTESSVRVYYSQMLPAREEECIIKMEEQALLLEEIKKETKGIKISSIAGKVAEILERKRILDGF